MEVAALGIERASRQFGAFTVPPLACGFDLDVDGVVGASDLLSALADFGEDGLGLSGDVDGDGIVGVGDILDILAFYGEPCAD